MIQKFNRIFSRPDWYLFIPALLISLFGLFTMYSTKDLNIYFNHQIIWIILASVVFLIFSLLDFRFLRRRDVIISLYIFTIFLLTLVLVIGSNVKGAVSRFHLGFFAIQPADPAKLVIIALLAKYFDKRHIEIANIRHIIISGAYAAFVFFLILIQPDFGSAIIILFIWFGMVLVSGISKKHLLLVVIGGIISSVIMWNFALHDYQKQRIMTFLHPLQDLQGAGYNAYQSVIAVGSGQIIGKGIGFGTQSKLLFLPEYQTDFIFASFTEEWGFIGAVILIFLYIILIFRIIYIASIGSTNYETLFAVGVATLIFAHFTIHIGMNIGVMPVTGITLPFMSYGGSHLLTEFGALGILSAMKNYARLTVNTQAYDYVG